MKFPVFKNLQLQEQFEREGFVKLKLFTSEQIEKLKNYYAPLREAHEANITFRSLYSSVETGSPELLIKLDLFVKDLIKEQVESVFQNYQMLISSFLVKEHGDDTELLPHQDLSFVDEPNFCSFNLWIPLQPTDKNSGQLRVLKGSHRIKHTLRVVPEYPRQFVKFQDTIRDLFTNIETQIGDCVVINHSILHGSSVNLTGKPRLAVILGICSSSTDVHYHYMPNGDNTRIEKYKMKAEDYYYFKPDGRPLHAPLAGIIQHEFEHITKKEFKNWIKNDPHLGFISKMKLLYFKKLENPELK
jgi:hypothetical protein